MFGPGGSARDWDVYPGGWEMAEYYPSQAILVHEGVVFAHMFVYGPSLVAIDQYTGEMLWAKGPMAAIEEDEWLDRYQASPAGARGKIIVPVVHDDIRGLTHVSSTAELAAYETRTGKLLWRRWLSRITPLKITQSHYPRKIRIFSTTPLVKDGVVYHVTNAGVVAAVDEQTGEVRWMTRYPQDKTVMDNFAQPGRVWRNEAPIIRGKKLYVTPVDCPLLLCIDSETGRILWTARQDSDSNWPDYRKRKGYPHVWRMVGFSADGSLVLTGHDVVLLDPDTGELRWRARLSS